MNISIGKLRQVQETPLSGQLRKQFLNNLDLNMPNQGDRSRFSNGYEINSEVEPTSGSSKKRRFMETMGDYKSYSSLDLELKLSPLGRSSENLTSHLRSLSSSITPSSEGTYLSCILGIEENKKGSINGKLPKLVLMGCHPCRTYTLASEVNPKCEKCKSSVLLDLFRENPSRRSKKPQFN